MTKGFQKLSEEISLEKLVTKTRYAVGQAGRSALLRRSADGRIGGTAGGARRNWPGNCYPMGKIGKTSDHHYYEVCTSPVIYDSGGGAEGGTQALGLENHSGRKLYLGTILETGGVRLDGHVFSRQDDFLPPVSFFVVMIFS